MIATRIPGVVGLVGEDYPALCSPGNTSELIALLNQLEQDSRFREELRQKTKKLALKFDPAREKEAWRRLLS